MHKINRNTIKEISILPTDVQFLCVGGNKRDIYRANTSLLESVETPSASLTYKEVLVSQTEIENLHTTPIVLLSELGVDSYYSNLRVEIIYLVGSTPYTATKNLNLNSQNGNGTSIILNGITVNQISIFTDSTNLNVNLSAQGAHTGGDGVLVIKLWYSEATVGS
jgi:hypothetical protein